MIQWDRAPRPEWQAALDRITPRTERRSHLVVQWVPFADGRFAHRYVIFEAVPFPYCNDLVARMDEEMLADPLMKWAWDYALEYGAFPVPFWVCQGNPMGHPYSYNAAEKAQATAGLIDEAPPAIGALPYSEPSALTWEAIRRRRAANATSWEDRERAKRDAQRQVRKDLMASTEAHLYEAVDEARRDLIDNAVLVDDPHRQDKANVTDDVFAQYMETGILPHLNT